jgi:hypothetical protein
MRWFIILLSSVAIGMAQVPPGKNPLYQANLTKTVAEAGGGGGSPTEVASDDFSSQAGFSDLDADADWEAEQGVNTILGGAVLCSNASGDSLHRWVTDAFNADQYASVIISAVGTTDAFGPAVRVQNAVTGYVLFYNENDTTLTLAYLSAGTRTTITSTTKNYVDGVALRLRCSGAGASARLNAWEDTGSGWVQVFTDENPAVDIDGGSAGIFSNNTGNNTTITSWAGGNW